METKYRRKLILFVYITCQTMSLQRKGKCEDKIGSVWLVFIIVAYKDYCIFYPQEIDLIKEKHSATTFIHNVIIFNSYTSR